MRQLKGLPSHKTLRLCLLAGVGVRSVDSFHSSVYFLKMRRDWESHSVDPTHFWSGEWEWDSHWGRIFHLIVFSSLLCFQIRAQAEPSGSVFFIDNPTRQFIRTPSQNDVAQSRSMSLLEVSAAVSVLLGFAPPASLSADGSSKLNEVLVPNPFDRPCAVFMLEVRGVGDPKLTDDLDNTQLFDAYHSKIIPGPRKADIQIPDEDQVSVVFLDELSEDRTDKEIRNFASWLGGSYVADTLEPLNGELIIPVADGDHVKLHMSKNIKRAVDVHEHLAQSIRRPAELMMGSFDGIKALQEQYGLGQIVGVVFFNETPSPQSESVLNLMYTSRPSPRMLAETEGSRNATLAAAEVLLVRRTLAWLTGIILIIATLFGIYFLLNMPLTRDTLLYSNVKLD
ncbi:hypothetical protein KPL71_026732 [Citrus sinensis]|uniref:Uncharacterized protein n=1 Tax=Citrus sinensis TaxID=2711 RepID=A0ACB8I1J3_CITSI|nr:hypothetical protein KPL71_026732 [Citrus sinensis]